MNKLPRETESFAQAFSKPEALPLDSARALPLTRWDSVPAPAGVHSTPDPIADRLCIKGKSAIDDGTNRGERVTPLFSTA